MDLFKFQITRLIIGQNMLLTAQTTSLKETLGAEKSNCVWHKHRANLSL